MAKKKQSEEEMLELAIGDMGGSEEYNSFEDDMILDEADGISFDEEGDEGDDVELAEPVNHGGKTGMLNTRIMSPEERRKSMYTDMSDRAKAKVTKVGENILEKTEIKEGWIPVDRSLLGERDIFYPEGWEFAVRPATVEAIKNWSAIDEEDPRSVNTVFNEVLKNCLSIRDAQGFPVLWSQINSWDRFWFVLLIREYTFVDGEAKIELPDDCIECDNPMKFPLSVTTLMYELPDPDVMRYWDRETRTWIIDPQEFGVDRDTIYLFAPTLEKDDNLLNYITDLYQKKGQLKRETEIFLKYLTWMLPKAQKDLTLLQRQVREAEMEYKSWTMEEFTFIDEVVRNIQVTPSTKLKQTCEQCGTECTTDIRFPDGIKSLFQIQRGAKKFGSK